MIKIEKKFVYKFISFIMSNFNKTNNTNNHNEQINKIKRDIILLHKKINYIATNEIEKKMLLDDLIIRTINDEIKEKTEILKNEIYNVLYNYILIIMCITILCYLLQITK